VAKTFSRGAPAPKALLKTKKIKNLKNTFLFWESQKPVFKS
jgi:hypothetical protein